MSTNSVKLIQLTHANNGAAIHVVAGLILAYWYSDAHKATLVVGSGGAMFPVKESVEEVDTKLCQ